MVPQQPLGLLPQLVADSLDHHDLLHQLRQGSRQLMLDQRLVGQIRRGAPGALAQQLDIQHAILQMVDLQLPAVGPQGRAHLFVQDGLDPLPLFTHVCSSCSAALAAVISSRMRWRVLSNSSSRLWRK